MAEREPHQHSEHCSCTRRGGVLSDIWDGLHGTKPQPEEMAEKKKEEKERDLYGGDGKGGGESF